MLAKILPALLLFFLFSVCSGTDHIVGGNRGWNPGMNYTLWANNQSFYVEDMISFRYQKNMYNVYMVNKTGFDNCTLDSATGNWSSGKDFITLTEAKWYYFICGNYGCQQGMKVAVQVLPLPSPPPSKHLNEKSAAAGHKLPWPEALGAIFGGMAVSMGWAWLV